MAQKIMTNFEANAQGKQLVFDELKNRKYTIEKKGRNATIDFVVENSSGDKINIKVKVKKPQP